MKTMALFEKGYLWPQKLEDVLAYLENACPDLSQMRNRRDNDGKIIERIEYTLQQTERMILYYLTLILRKDDSGTTACGIEVSASDILMLRENLVKMFENVQEQTQLTNVLNRVELNI